MPCVKKIKKFNDWIEKPTKEDNDKECERLKQRLFSDGYLYFYQNNN